MEDDSEQYEDYEAWKAAVYDHPEAEAERRVRGRYNVYEATALINHDASQTSQAFYTLSLKLMRATRAGKLPSYLAGSSIRQMHYWDDEKGWWPLEMYWNDLNKWLQKNETRVAFRFPSPSLEGETAYFGDSDQLFR